MTGTNVTDIAIAGIADVTAPVAGEGRITITYGGQTGTALGAALMLTPGSGTVDNAADPSNPLAQGSPVVWGCGITPTASFKYVPANCRYVPN